MRGRPEDRRRYAAAYAWSIAIHAAVLAFLAAFAMRAIETDELRERVVADTRIDVRTETPPPPLPVQPVPVAVPTPRPAPPVQHELARVTPSAPPQPTPRPAAVTVPEPTARPAPAPAPTAVPVPTDQPAVVPPERPTPSPTAPPTERPTAPPTERPTAAPTERPTAVATEPPPAPPVVAAAPAAPATPGSVATVRPEPATATAPPPAPAPRSPPPPAPARTAPPPSPAPAPTAAPENALAGLNARLRAALPTAPVAGMQRVDVGAYDADRALDAYEAALDPPLEILAKTFGLIYTTRTVLRADSVAYVYEHMHDLLGRDVCRAYRITEHPLRDATPPPNRLGPGAADMPETPRDVKPVVETVDVSCTAPGMIPVVPGSLTSPVPRHPPAR